MTVNDRVRFEVLLDGRSGLACQPYMACAIIDPQWECIEAPFGHGVKVSAQRGFTLVELIAILVIVGIVSVFAVGRLSSIGSSTFSQRALYDKLTASIEYARKMAVAQRRYVCVRTDSTNNLVTFTTDTTAPETRGNASCASPQSATEQVLLMPVPDSVCQSETANAAYATYAVCAPSGVTFGNVTTPLTFDATGANITGSSVIFYTTPNLTVEAVTGYVH